MSSASLIQSLRHTRVLVLHPRIATAMNLLVN